MSIEIPDSFEDLSPSNELPTTETEEIDFEEEVVDEDIKEEVQEEDDEIAVVESPKVAPGSGTELSTSLKDEIKSVLAYMDKLLEALPEEKIEEFARSEHFEVYKRLFEELGL